MLGLCHGLDDKFFGLGLVLARTVLSRCFVVPRQLSTWDLPLGAASHVPVSGGHSGAIQAGLRKRRTGWVPAYLVRRLQSVPNAAARLIYRMRSADHVHHRRYCLPSPAARPETDRLQGRCAGEQSFTPKCAAVSGTTRSCCRSSRSTDITLWWHQSSDGAIC